MSAIEYTTRIDNKSLGSRPLMQRTDVFIVRIWRESRELPDAIPVWRGVVEHIHSGRRQYIQSLQDLTAFLNPFLVETNEPMSGLNLSSDSAESSG